MSKANMNFQESDPIVLGSGEIYLGLYKDIEDVKNLTVEEEEALVNIGAIESGATITIGNNFENIESDNRGIIARFNQGKDIVFSTGVMTWNLENLGKFITGSEVDVEEGIKKLTLSDKDQSTDVYIRFVHEFKDGSGELIVNLFKTQFTGDLELVFSKEGATTANYEFSANAVGKGSDYLEVLEIAKEEEEEIEEPEVPEPEEKE